MMKLITQTTGKASISLALLLLRITFGASMIYGHGKSKLMKFFAEEPLSFSDPLGIGVTASLSLATFAEFFCAIFLIFGLFTRAVAIPLIITMGVVIFVVQWGEPFGKIEKALLFFMVFVSFLITGGGKYSLDYMLFSKKSA